MGHSGSSGISLGHALTCCGCAEAMGMSFNDSASILLNMHGIEPWDARSLIRENLQKQALLAKRTPLRYLNVEDGLAYFRYETRSIIKGWSQGLTREQFISAALTLLAKKEIPISESDRDDLYEIFDSMDFDRNGQLSTGEWAAGLSVFFRGPSLDATVHAVFRTLDTNENRSLSRAELQEYLAPFVKAMSPPEADPLRPLLLKKAVDDIYAEMDLDHRNDISSQEFLHWTRKGNNIVDRLVRIIENEVYKAWLEQSKKNHPHLWNPWMRNGEFSNDPYDKDRPVHPMRSSMAKNKPMFMGPGMPGAGGMHPNQYAPVSSMVQPMSSQYAPPAGPLQSGFGFGSGYGAGPGGQGGAPSAPQPQGPHPHDPFSAHGSITPPHPGRPPTSSSRWS